LIAPNLDLRQGFAKERRIAVMEATLSPEFMKMHTAEVKGPLQIAGGALTYTALRQEVREYVRRRMNAMLDRHDLFSRKQAQSESFADLTELSVRAGTR